ncbi:MAG: hypothetical protein HC852_08125 [Acaryochloridaceae cyanobacterium RU_4_10]|nr:hypothetical protein [Acaryochloridaceae cyanobacterium RU_4_10]
MSPTQQYQSRFFKTVQSQLRQVQDNIQLRWREFKVAATWGAQLSLYPFYVLFQAGRWGGRVLKQTATQSARMLSAALGLESTPDIDQPVKNVLAALELQLVPTAEISPQVSEWQINLRPATSPKRSFREKFSTIWQQLFLVEPSTPSVTVFPSQPLSLQGVASSLSDRHLVLMATDNQPLDILSADQQRQLHQRIIWELANVMRSHRQSQAAKTLPSWKTWKNLPISVRPQMILPVRAVHQLMAWIQHQPIAQSPVLPGTQTPPVQQPLPISIRGSLSLGLMAENLLARTKKVLSLRQQSALALMPQQETPLPTPSLSTRIGQRLKGYRGAIVAGIGAIALLPFALAIPEPAHAAAAPALPMPIPSPIAVEWLIDTSKTRRRSKEETDLLGQVSKPSQGKVRIPVQKSPTPLNSATNFETRSPIGPIDFPKPPSQQDALLLILTQSSWATIVIL